MTYGVSFPDRETLVILEAADLGELLVQLVGQYPEYRGRRVPVYKEPRFCDGEYGLDKPDCDDCDEMWLCDDGMTRLIGDSGIVHVVIR